MTTPNPHRRTPASTTASATASASTDTDTDTDTGTGTTGSPVPGIDPRGPRFAAGITALTLLVVIGFALSDAVTIAAIVLAAITVLFAWGTTTGVKRSPYGFLFARFVRPRLTPATDLEDPSPPRFAQGFGLVVTGVGVLLFLLGVPAAIPIAAAAAFVAAFLNSVFGYCLGCQVYLLLVRASLIRPSAPAPS